jgi:hypothetical protein
MIFLKMCIGLVKKEGLELLTFPYYNLKYKKISNIMMEIVYV